MDAVAQDIGVEVADALAVLGNETRLAILLALWEAYEPFYEGDWDASLQNVLSFSELRDRIGVRDSGQFNYHLGKIEGVFVESTSEGYRLHPAGQQLMYTLVARAGFTAKHSTQEPLDIPCPVCDSATAITYQNQRLYHVCTACEGTLRLSDPHPSGVIGAWPLNPMVMEQRTPEELFTAVRMEEYHAWALHAAGICSNCLGRIETGLRRCESHESVDNSPCAHCGNVFDWIVQFGCTICKQASEATLAEFSIHNPRVVAFYWDRGIELGLEDLDWSTAKLILSNLDRVDNQALVSTNPPRMRVSFRHEDDEIQLTYDDRLTVVDVNRTG